ncbi:MAG: MarR family transcriptional regulator [Ruminococcus sp.]|nr:MarR family transcriptional regulator [Ruminococcus sp.]MCM1381595.1 MarR family transcriptional regulator [Muribaculaceae bacterium]MCM1478653.1 MarR family transcriptional regulator [Muribaculaceae bacterium]
METNDKYAVVEQFRRMRQFMNAVPLKTGISHSEFCLLNIIAFGKDGITVSEIAAELDVTPPAVSRSLKSLESKGLITRETKLTNRRNTTVRLTENGLDFLQKSRRQMDGLMEYVGEKMGAERKKLLYELLGEMTEIIKNYVKGENDDKNT